jgi:preprotein translocase subunit SecE
VAPQPPKPQTLRQTLTEPRRPAGGRFQYIREVWGELKKVVWPSRQDTTRLTQLVIAVAVAIGILLGIIDMAFNQIFTRFIVGS